MTLNQNCNALSGLVWLRIRRLGALPQADMLYPFGAAKLDVSLEYFAPKGHSQHSPGQRPGKSLITIFSMP